MGFKPHFDHENADYEIRIKFKNHLTCNLEMLFFKLFVHDKSVCVCVSLNANYTNYIKYFKLVIAGKISPEYKQYIQFFNFWLFSGHFSGPKNWRKWQFWAYFSFKILNNELKEIPAIVLKACFQGAISASFKLMGVMALEVGTGKLIFKTW